ncbi:hypothetical protein J4E93_010511 [Alternaria ventricosa]|uniref:uncharacterized protein n=1 Tax=Alternaria ventricosa TaxID=1187951 RepID=UPI0020C491E9|nr:uncharacterized protein J4E93_010511 [Alternaria ventricosa]KAI4638043.1 hypothetical protein J4E93_010511 [Alternaria ventricosa]
MAMSKYETIIWEKEMKDEIKFISYKQRIFAPGPAKYRSALIVYDGPDDNYWRVLMCADSSESSVGASLEALLGELRELMESHMSESHNTLAEQVFCTLMLT